MSGLYKVPQSSLVRFFLTGPIGQCCKLPPIKTGQRDNLSNAQGYRFDVTLVLWRYDPRHTCALFGLCYTPATQTPPSGWPACEGFYPREGCCWSCSHRMQMTALATSGQADNLCKTGEKKHYAKSQVGKCVYYWSTRSSYSYQSEPPPEMLEESESQRTWQDLCGQSGPAEHHTGSLRCWLSPGGPQQAGPTGGEGPGRRGKPSSPPLQPKKELIILKEQNLSAFFASRNSSFFSQLIRVLANKGHINVSRRRMNINTF